MAKRRKNTIARSRLLENAISGLRHIGFERFQSNREFVKHCEQGAKPERYIIRNFPHPALYGTPGRKEALIYDRGHKYIFEAKYQNGSGSTDEKMGNLWFAFLASDIQDWIVWFDGNYWTQASRGIASIVWFRNHIQTNPIDGRQLYVCSSDDEWTFLVKKLFNGSYS